MPLPSQRPDAATGPPEPVGPSAASDALVPRGPISRRGLLKLGLAGLAGLAASKLGFDWLSRTVGPDVAAAAVDARVASYDPTAHRWGFVVDTDKCIGCGLCVVACKQENHVPFDPEHTRTWVERHAVSKDGTVAIDSPGAGIGGFALVAAPQGVDGKPVARTHFVPRLCMQCENPPCVGVCPVGATYRTPDGITLVDAQRCIGCGYCLIACPYGARYLVPAGAREPAGVAGVADKCTFCYHRVVRGQDPACVTVCPVGARVFGDLNDPGSKVSEIIATQPTTVLKAAQGTRPRVHYVGMEGEVET